MKNDILIKYMTAKIKEFMLRWGLTAKFFLKNCYSAFFILSIE